MPQWPDFYRQEYMGSFDNRQQFLEREIAPMAMALYDDINRQYNQQSDQGLFKDVALRMGAASVDLICETVLNNDEFRMLRISGDSSAVPAYILGPIDPTYKYYEMRYDCRPILVFLRRITGMYDVPFGSVVATFRRMAIERIEERVKAQTTMQEYMPQISYTTGDFAVTFAEDKGAATANEMSAAMDKAREIIKSRAAEMEARLEEELKKSIKGTVTQKPKRNEITLNVEIEPLSEEKFRAFIEGVSKIGIGAGLAGRQMRGLAERMSEAFVVGNPGKDIRGIVIDEYATLPKKRDKSVKVTTPKKRAIDL